MGLFSNRKKRYEAVYPRRYKGLDGNWYRSLSELVISYFLERFGIRYETEASIFRQDRNFKYDWKIIYKDEKGVKHTIFLEFFGYSGRTYAKRKKEKLRFYRQRGFELISIIPSDLDDIDRKLRNKLKKHWKYIVGSDTSIKSLENKKCIDNQLNSMETDDLTSLKTQIDTILHSRKKYLPIIIETIGQFNRKLKRNAYVSVLCYVKIRKGLRNKENYEYIALWNSSPCKEVEVVQYHKKFDPKNKNLYSAKWDLKAREGTIIVYRRNAREQKMKTPKTIFSVVDGSQTHQNPKFLREIPAKLAYELAKENHLLTDFGNC